MSLVLSHTTAYYYYQTVARPEQQAQVWAEPSAASGEAFEAGPPSKKLVSTARRLLAAYGVPSDELGVIDVLVVSQKDRRTRRDVACHLYRNGAGGISEAAVHHIFGEIYVVGVPLCALQAAERMSFRECVEYYYELCGCYRMPLDSGESYAECRPATSVEELRDFFAANSGARGVATARRAIEYVRNGARSPMETALIMMIVMPKKEGGLGIRGVEMDYRIPVSKYASRLTRSRNLYCDIFVPSAGLTIEYGGRVHEEVHRRARDNERTNALRAMGYDVIDVSRENLFDRDGFERTIAAIGKKVGVRPSRLPGDFAERQEDLRQFVLRRWLGASEEVPPELGSRSGAGGEAAGADTGAESSGADSFGDDWMSC